MKQCVSVALIALSLAPGVATSQALPSKRTGGIPRTPWGHPDLQGIWSSATHTSLERPAELAQKTLLTEVEAIEWAKQGIERLKKQVGVEGQINGEFSEVWLDQRPIVPDRRTSLITDPPDGRIPYTEEGRKRWQSTPSVFRQNSADGPEDRPLPERCIVWMRKRSREERTTGAAGA